VLAGSEFRPWAIVPAKAFARAKSRLDRVMAPPARRVLARARGEREFQP
jgi:hypothetical protein